MDEALLQVKEKVVSEHAVVVAERFNKINPLIIARSYLIVI